MALFETTQVERTTARVIDLQTRSEVHTPLQASARSTNTDYLTFSSPFQKIGHENLSLPYINDQLTGMSGWVRFGRENDFPQKVNQMYYTSPINGAIIDFKTNATVGGGYTVKPLTDSFADKAKALVFDRRFNISRLIKPLTRDLIMHSCAYMKLIFSEDGRLLKFTRIPREHVRNSKDKKLYFISPDWTTQQEIVPIRKFNGVNVEREHILCFEEDSVGQDTYSIAPYTSCLNWCFLDGEMSFLHKSNIQNSIYSSFVLMFPKKPSGEREKNAIKQTIEGAKGAGNAGRVLALFANKPEQMPKIEPIPVNQNDKLFEQTDERIDAQVCKAHVIDPILMGIRVAGKLGSGTDIKQAYVIFEKNTIIPIREQVERIFNQLLQISGTPAVFTVNNFQIINETITQTEGQGNQVLDALNKLSPLVATKVLDSMTVNQKLGLIGLPPIEGGDVPAALTSSPIPAAA